ncbi:MAG: SpoIIE family protein phosphatase [Bacteroidetes bacterium]|nr:SpoIIE family protein phosphatase [Bacteroidota bacterium]
MPRKGIGIVFFLFLLNQLIISQILIDNTIRFKRIGVEDGLSQNNANSIIQDSRGFMWFATQDGLNCYNGYNFKVYKKEIRNANSIPNNNVIALHQGRDGNIWIGTITGLAKYNPILDSFEVFKNDPNNLKSISSDEINVIYQDKNNDVYIGTDNAGLNIFKPETKEFIRLGYEKYNSRTLSSNNIKAIYEDPNGAIWIGTNNGLCLMDKSTYRTDESYRFTTFKNNPENPNSLPSNNITSICGSNGIVWIGTSDGLCAYNPNTKKYTTFKHNKEDPTSIAGNAINKLFEDYNGNLWIGFSEAAGLDMLDVASKKFIHNINIEGVETSLSGNTVSSIFQDNSRNIWVSAGNNGLNVFNPYYNSFITYEHVLKSENSLVDNTVFSIAETPNKNIWIGTLGGLSKYDKSTNTFTHYSVENKLLGSNVVRSVIYDSQRKCVWAGTYGGLYQIEESTGKILKEYKHNPQDPQSLSHNAIRCMYLDKTGALWIGTSEGGVNLLTPDNGRFKTHKYDPNDETSISSNRISCIYEDVNGTIFVGTLRSGLNELNTTTLDFKHFKHNDNDSSSISNDVVYSIFEDNMGNLWVGTTLGLNLFNKRTGKFKAYTESDGLPNNTIYSIMQDKQSNLWLSTNYGLCRIKTPETIIAEYKKYGRKIPSLIPPEIKNYNVQDGLPTVEFNIGAAHKNEKGMFYYGCIKGVVGFHPDSIKKNEFISPVFITDFKVFGKSISNDTSIAFKKQIELMHYDNNISISFVTLNYIAPEKNLYKFKLEGVDKDWSPITNNTFAPYQNLDPGKYVFRVKASNNDGVWNEEGASIEIIIHPPWYWNNWSRVIYAVILSLLIFIYIKWREKDLQLQKKILEKKVMERTRQLKKEKDRVELAYMEIDTKNKEITDSIKYAKRLQEAILTPEEHIRQDIPESFVLYKPKDIVSGDFYYYNKTLINDLVIIAAVDCTGHGVPGAFMSIVGNNLLNQAVNDHLRIKPSEILDELNKSLSETLKQTLTEASVKDGMDIALCSLDLKNQKLQYAGAYNPIWIVRPNIVDSDLVMKERTYPIGRDILEIRADKFPVGAFVHKETQLFTNHELQLKKGDTFYIFSDGYADQFGGPKGKKFKYNQLQELIISIQHKPMAEQKKILDTTIENWRGNLEQLDDILVIGVRFT